MAPCLWLFDSVLSSEMPSFFFMKKSVSFNPYYDYLQSSEMIVGKYSSDRVSELVKPTRSIQVHLEMTYKAWVLIQAAPCKFWKGIKSQRILNYYIIYLNIDLFSVEWSEEWNRIKVDNWVPFVWQYFLMACKCKRHHSCWKIGVVNDVCLLLVKFCPLLGFLFYDWNR